MQVSGIRDLHFQNGEIVAQRRQGVMGPLGSGSEPGTLESCPKNTL